MKINNKMDFLIIIVINNNNNKIKMEGLIIFSVAKKIKIRISTNLEIFLIINHLIITIILEIFSIIINKAKIINNIK